MVTEDTILAKHLLLVINEPFRPSTANDKSRLCCEFILILRRILLIIAQTFIMSSISKLHPMVLLLLLFTFHHQKMKPFTDDILNDMEFGSLLVLLSLVFVDLFRTNTREYDLLKFPHYKTMGKVLMFYEMFIFSLPVLLILFYILFRIFKIIFKAFKHFGKKQD